MQAVYTIRPPKKITASILLPASKSISNRALILKALSNSVFPVENLSCSDDTQVMLKALESGDAVVNIGAAGTAMRFLTAYFSQCRGYRMITGSERMKNRPIRILAEALRQTGAEINYPEKEGFPPLQIAGRKLRGGEIVLDGSVSSQYLSALMMVAPAMEKGLTVRLEGNIISRPYINMTLRLMELFGVKTFWEGNIIRIAPQIYTARPFKVESDWSAASYWYETAALAQGNSEIELSGLEKNSLQGDSKAAEIFENLGIKTDFLPSGNVHLTRLPTDEIRLERFQYNFVNEPDLAQTLAVTCCLSEIPFRFSGLQSLKIKETDRISALQNELKKLGCLVKSPADGLLEWGGERCEPEPDPVISTYEDHRMAMAFAPVCLKTGKIRIREPEVVSKSYPGFWNDLEKAGYICIAG
ncbi:MAG: 3-phosphoshikimate 1-carboxyvinyltransferase [Dysgonamonadaceae bacterium]|jgi:3-phosphoshikimate 1-carboxyvinyltransferase|nr:3-phosphoshikimate 1-carboxyvinyltransferase [Dysgonamonadaceae bacterium]